MSDATPAPDIAAIVRGAELMIHAPAIRRERATLERILAPDFVAFGTSGLVWTRSEFLDSVMRFESSTSGFELSEMVTRLVTDDVMLVTYVTTLGERRARRASLWRIEADGPKLVFHQGATIS